MTTLKINIHYTQKTPIKTFADLRKEIEETELCEMNWMFRGHSNAQYGLVTTFERLMKKFNLDLFPDDPSLPIPGNNLKAAHLAILEDDLRWLNDDALRKKLIVWRKAYRSKHRTGSDYEIQIIREFQRKAKNHFPSSVLPNDREDYFQWLTFMQHFGAPTRLLDWTYSFYVALFFAIRNYNVYNEYGKQNQFCIWAIQQNRLDGVVFNHIWSSALLDMKKKDNGDRNKDFMNYQISFDLTKNNGNMIPCPSVVTMTPYEMNERLAIQQGTFLAGSITNVTFESSLINVLDTAAVKEHCKPGDIVKQLVCEFDSGEMRKTWQHLKRMNITAASLFPNQGASFAESVGNMLAIPAFRLAESKNRSI